MRPLNVFRKMPSRLRRRLLGLPFRWPLVQRLWAARQQAPVATDVPWTPLRKALGECRVALVTTGGVHLSDDQPFDMSDGDGDPSYRVIPSHSATTALTITHDYYDHRAADRDVNVVFPIDPLRALQAEGRIGPAAEHFYGMMGHIRGTHLETLQRATAPALAEHMRSEGVDVAILTPA